MGLFDTVRSLFGSDEASTDEPEDDRSDEQSSDDAVAESESVADDAETDRQGDADAEAGESGPADETATDEPSGEVAPPGEADEPPAEVDEPTADDTSETVADDESTDEEEKISWEETGFEQLTDQLVEEDEEEADAADLITEAEPDRDDAASEAAETSVASEASTPVEEPDTGTSVEGSDTGAPTEGSEADRDDADDGSRGDTDEAFSSASDTTDSAAESVDAGLPLDEEEAAARTDDAEGLADVDVPEDSTRAAYVEEAVDLAAFWSEYDLNFTADSLARVDDLIAEQWGPDRFEGVEYGGEDYDSEVFTGLVWQIGSYLGEVLLRVNGGEWVETDGDEPAVDLPADAVDSTDTTVPVFDLARTSLTDETTLAAAYDAALAGEAGGGAPSIDQADVDAVSGGDDDRGDAPERLQAGGEDLAERWPHYDLDFTVESLTRLEALLEAEVDGERFVDAELGDETDRESMLLTAHAVGVGGYFAEVLRRQREATWDTGRMVLLVETDDGETTVDPIDTAVACIRGEGSLVETVP